MQSSKEIYKVFGNCHMKSVCIHTKNRRNRPEKVIIIIMMSTLSQSYTFHFHSSFAFRVQACTQINMLEHSFGISTNLISLLKALHFLGGQSSQGLLGGNAAARFFTSKEHARKLP